MKSCARTGSGKPFGCHSSPASFEIVDQFLLGVDLMRPLILVGPSRPKTGLNLFALA
jgi:hypothetical protein